MLQHVRTESGLCVSWEIPQQPGHALRMFLMSEVKSMASRNALRIVNIIKGILMTLQRLFLITQEKVTKCRIYQSDMMNDYMVKI